MKKVARYSKLAIFIVFAVLIGVYNHTLLENLRYLVPSLLMGYGLDSIVSATINEKKNCYKNLWFSYGIGEIIIGVTLISIEPTFEVVCVVWGVWSIFREVIEIYEILSGEVKGVPALISGIESIVAITFSVLLIITPIEEHAHTHIYLLIAELLVTGFIPVIDDIILTRKKHR